MDVRERRRERLKIEREKKHPRGRVVISRDSPRTVHHIGKSFVIS